MKTNLFFIIVLLAIPMCFASQTHAAGHALLIGVSEYPRLPQDTNWKVRCMMFPN